MGLLSKYDTFIFDWDGTLLSGRVLSKINEKINPYWRYRKQSTFETKQIKKRGSGARQAELRAMAPFFDMFVALMKPKLHNDSVEVLQALKKRHKRVALFTNGATYRVQKELSYLKVRGYFDTVVSAQSLNALKPNPMGLEFVIRKERAKRQKTIYIGDMVDDVLMAKYAKVASCGISGGFDSYGRLKASRPDYLFRSMEEFRKAL